MDFSRLVKKHLLNRNLKCHREDLKPKFLYFFLFYLFAIKVCVKNCPQRKIYFEVSRIILKFMIKMKL